MPNLRTEYAKQMAQYRNLTQYFDPIWSPDNTHLVFAVWQNGRLDFQLLDVAQRKRWKLAALHSVPSCRPVWSRHGEYLAYADLNSAKILHIDNAQLRDFPLPYAKEHPNETLLQFSPGDDDAERLLISGDTNLFSSYGIIELDPQTLHRVRESSDQMRPQWAADSTQQARWFETRRAVAPNGAWTALIEETRGVRRLVLRSRDGRESFRVADVAVQKVGNSVNLSTPTPINHINQINLNAAMKPRNLELRKLLALASEIILLVLLGLAWKIFQRTT